MSLRITICLHVARAFMNSATLMRTLIMTLDYYFLLCQINGRPRVEKVTHNSLTVKWNRPTYPFPVPSHYDVYLRKASDSEPMDCIRNEDGTCTLTITNLPMNTEFVARVRACCETEQGPLGDESRVITTKNLAYKVKDESTERPHVLPSLLPVYDVPCHVERNEELKTCTIIIGIKSIQKWYLLVEVFKT